MIRNVLSLALMLVLLNACSAMNPVNWFGEKDNTEPPAELVDMENEIPVSKVWDKDLGEGSGKFLSGLTLAEKDGLLAVADQKGMVQAISIETHNVEWTTDTGVAISAGPGFSDELVLVGSEEAEVIALDLNSGEEVWRKPMPGEVLSAPSGSSGVVVTQTSNDRLIGMDAATGDVMWRYQGKVPLLSLRGAAAPLVDIDVVYIGQSDGKLTALDLSTGRVLWSTVIAYASGRGELNRMIDIDSSPVLYEGAIYVGAFQGKIAAVSSSSGVVLWDRKLSTHLPMAVDWRYVYATDENSHVWALDPRNGSAMWQQKKLRLRELTAPVSFGDYVVVGDYEGYVHWLSSEDGRLLAREKVSGSPIVVTPVVINEQLYVYAADGTLAIFELPTSVENL